MSQPGKHFQMLYMRKLLRIFSVETNEARNAIIYRYEIGKDLLVNS